MRPPSVEKNRALYEEPAWLKSAARTANEILDNIVNIEISLGPYGRGAAAATPSPRTLFRLLAASRALRSLGAPLSAEERAVAELWRRSLPATPSRIKRNADVYERAQTGPGNYKMPAGKETIDADGFRPSDGFILETKHIDNPVKSPYIPGSKAFEPVRQKAMGEVRGRAQAIQGGNRGWPDAGSRS